MMRRWLCAVSLLVLQGCSTVKLGYPQLPQLGYWWLDSKLSLNDQQSAATREALDRLLRWHRDKELLPEAELLARAAQQASGPVQAQQLCQLWQDVLKRMDVTMRETVAQATPVAQQLGPRQLGHLARHWEQQNEDWEKEWLQGPAPRRLQQRVKRAVERYEDFYGDLNAAQLALVRSQVEQSAWTAEWGRLDRLRRQQDLLGALRRIHQEQLDAARTEAELWGVWQRWLSPPAPADLAVTEGMAEQGCETLAQLHNSATPQQRQRAQRKLRGYESDLRELASRP
jgi:hypothetical protein